MPPNPDEGSEDDPTPPDPDEKPDVITISPDPDEKPDDNTISPDPEEKPDPVGVLVFWLGNDKMPNLNYMRNVNMNLWAVEENQRIQKTEANIVDMYI